MADELKKVLVIDDNKEWTELLCTSLNQQYVSLGALDGRQGMEIAIRELPDIILCDIVMPQMTGAEVLRGLQAHPVLQHAQVIMMTANKLDAPTQNLFKEHPNVRGFLIKPCNVADVLRTVEYVIKTPNKRQPAAPQTPPPAPAASAPTPTPVPRALAPTPAPTPASQKPAKQYKILIIDDDVNFFQFLNLVVHRDDLVYRATDGAQAMAQLESVIPDVIVTDLMMPGMSGIEVMRAMQRNKRYASIPTIFLTAAHIDQRNREMLFKEFPNLKFLLNKPCEVSAIRNALDSLLPRDLTR